MCSREGEVVSFKTPISLKENPKIHEWLTNVEEQMRVTLATLLENAINDLKSLLPNDQQAYENWIDKYPTQLVTLATQVIWSQGIDKSLFSGILIEYNNEISINIIRFSYYRKS